MDKKKMDRLNDLLACFGLPLVLVFSIFYGTAYVDRTPVPACGVHVSRNDCDEFKEEIFSETLVEDVVKVSEGAVSLYMNTHNQALEGLHNWVTRI